MGSSFSRSPGDVGGLLSAKQSNYDASGLPGLPQQVFFHAGCPEERGGAYGMASLFEAAMQVPRWETVDSIDGAWPCTGQHIVLRAGPEVNSEAKPGGGFKNENGRLFLTEFITAMLETTSIF